MSMVPTIIDWSDFDRLRKLFKKAKSQVSPKISEAGIKAGAEAVQEKVKRALNKPNPPTLKELRKRKHPFSKKRYKNSSIKGRVTGEPWYGVYKRAGGLYENVIIKYDNSGTQRSAIILMDPSAKGNADGQYPANKKGIAAVLAGTSRMKGRNVFALAIREKGTVDHVRSVMATAGVMAWREWIRSNVSIKRK